MSLSADLLLRSLVSVDMSAIAAELTPPMINWLADAGMAPIVLAGLESVTRQPDTAALEKLTAVNLSARFESAARIEAFKEILAASEDDADIGLLKGMLFAHDFYPKAHFRPMGDIDLLIPAEKTGKLSSILLELGYVNRAMEPANYFDTHHHLMPFYHDKKRVCIEVHTGLFPFRSGLAGTGPFDPDKIQSRLRTTDFFGKPIKALRIELQLLHTATHWAEEFRRVGGMLGLLDAAMLLQLEFNNINWDWIFSHGSNSAHIAPTQLLLGYLDRSGVIKLDKSVARSLHRYGRLCKTALRIQHDILDERVVLGRPPGAILTDANLLSSWKLLLHAGQNELVLAKLLWNIVFPREAEERYKIGYQLGRLKNLRARW